MKRFEMFVLAVVMLICFGFGNALAQQQGGTNRVTIYSAKFVCWNSNYAATGPGTVLSPADYLTAINIHNQTNRRVAIRKQIVFTEVGSREGPVVSGQSPQVPDERFEARDLLRPLGAVEWDCTQLARGERFNPYNAFAKGFLIITADTVGSTVAPTLGVVGVYTSQGKNLFGYTVCPTGPTDCDQDQEWSSGDVTLHLEQYQGRATRGPRIIIEDQF